MAKKEKTCPACDKKIDDSAKECPECKKKLEILHWEVEADSGEKIVFSEPNTEDSIREQLISGKFKLINRCRQFTTVLQRVTGENDHYETKDEKEWKTLKDYANSSFSLQVLYNPVQAYGKRVAFIATATIGIITAIGWDTQMLLDAGANPIIAVILSILLLVLTPTVIGLAIGSYVVGRIYSLPPFGMAFRTFFAMVIGAIIGAAVGWTIGYLIGVIIGLTKKKVLAEDYEEDEKDLEIQKEELKNEETYDTMREKIVRELDSELKEDQEITILKSMSRLPYSDLKKLEFNPKDLSDTAAKVLRLILDKIEHHKKSIDESGT